VKGEKIMVHVVVHHQVKDYAQWKGVFDEHAKVRRDSGSQGGRIFRDEKDPDNVTLLLLWDNMAKARIFFESSFLQHEFDRAGVICPPEISFEAAAFDA
jgi:hypothetical protein